MFKNFINNPTNKNINVFNKNIFVYKASYIIPIIPIKVKYISS